MLDGFKKFIMRGNVIDLAVGVIIGAAWLQRDLRCDSLAPPGFGVRYSVWRRRPSAPLAAPAAECPRRARALRKTC